MKTIFKNLPITPPLTWMIVFMVATLSACASQPGQANISTLPTSLGKHQLEFVDLGSFDRELSNALSSKVPAINVAVVSTTQATAIPERLQMWLHAVEDGGGKVSVTPPQSTVAAKNPLLLLTLVSGVWNGIKASKAIQSYELHRPARTYDAEIVLKISAQGDRLIDKIIFTEKKPV